MSKGTLTVMPVIMENDYNLQQVHHAICSKNASMFHVQHVTKYCAG